MMVTDKKPNPHATKLIIKRIHDQPMSSMNMSFYAKHINN